MNYIKEIIAFYDRQVLEPLSSSAVSLWHALMHINNKTRWKNEFTAIGTYLQFIAGLSSSSFKRARAELVEHGYIQYESLGRGRAPRYTLNSLLWEDEETTESVSNVADQHMKQLPDEGTVKVENILPTIQRSDHGSFVAEKVADHHGQTSGRSMDQHATYPFASTEIGESTVDQAVDPTGSSLMNKPVTAQPNYSPDSSFIEETTVHQEVYKSVQPVNQVSTQHADHHQNEPPAPLYKQNINKKNTKQNKTKKVVAEYAHADNFADEKCNDESQADAIRFYQQNFGITSTFVMESILDWTSDLGDDLVIEAMKRALERNKTNWGYVKGILNAWFKKGIRTVEQAKAEQLGVTSQLAKKEVIPDWFYKQKREREEQEKHTPKQKATLADLERVKQEYLEAVGKKKIVV